jgi:hypothetical protein
MIQIHATSIDLAKAAASPAEVVGVGRLVKEPLAERGEVAALISDAYRVRASARRSSRSAYSSHSAKV